MSADNLASLVVREAGIREERLAEALRWQVMHGGQLDTALQEMGLLDERTLLVLLAKAFGLAAVGRDVIDRVDKETVEFFPRRLAEKYGVVPIAHAEGRLIVAVTHSPDFSLLEEISEVLRAHVQPVVTTELRMNYALYRLYGAPLMSRMENLLGLLGEDPEEIPSLAFVSDEKTSFSSMRPGSSTNRAGFSATMSRPSQPENFAPSAVSPTAMNASYGAAGLGVDTAGGTSTSPVMIPSLPSQPAQDLAVRHRREAVRARLLARLEAEENAERHKEEERRTKRVPWTVDDVIAELALADNRDAMLDIVLRFAYRKLQTAAIFIIQRQPRPDGSKSPVFVGWDIIDPTLIREDIVRLTIPVDGEHVLGNLWLMRSHYLGPMREDDPLRVSFGQSPRAALLVPILVGEHLIGALYGDGGEHVIPPASLAELQMVVPRLGKALGNLIVRKRHAAKPMAPFTESPTSARADRGALDPITAKRFSVVASPTWNGDHANESLAPLVNEPAPVLPAVGSQTNGTARRKEAEPFAPTSVNGATGSRAVAQPSADHRAQTDVAPAPDPAVASTQKKDVLGTLTTSDAADEVQLDVSAISTAPSTAEDAQTPIPQPHKKPQGQPQSDRPDWGAAAQKTESHSSTFEADALVAQPVAHTTISEQVQGSGHVEAVKALPVREAEITAASAISTRGQTQDEVDPKLAGAAVDRTVENERSVLTASEEDRPRSGEPGEGERVVSETQQLGTAEPSVEAAPSTGVEASEPTDAANVAPAASMGEGDSAPKTAISSSDPANAGPSSVAELAPAQPPEAASSFVTDVSAQGALPAERMAAADEGTASEEATSPFAPMGADSSSKVEGSLPDAITMVTAGAKNTDTPPTKSDESPKTGFALAPPSPRQTSKAPSEVSASEVYTDTSLPQEHEHAVPLSAQAAEAPTAAGGAVQTDFAVEVDLASDSTPPRYTAERTATEAADADDLDVELAQEHLVLQERVPEIDQALERLQASSSGSFLATMQRPMGEPPVEPQDGIVASTTTVEMTVGADAGGSVPNVEARGEVSSDVKDSLPEDSGSEQDQSSAQREHVPAAQKAEETVAGSSEPTVAAPKDEESIALDLEAISVFDPLRRFARGNALSPPVAPRTSDLPTFVDPLREVQPEPQQVAPSDAARGDQAREDANDSSSASTNQKPERVRPEETANSSAQNTLAPDIRTPAVYNTIPESPGEDARESTLLQTWRAWLDASDGEADQRVCALEGGNGVDEELCTWVCGLRERSAAALARSFPGKLTMHPFGSAAARPSVSELSEICACLVELGPTLAAPILVGELSHDDRMHRFAAVWSLSELYVPAAVPSLAQRLFDREMRIARIALEVLGRYRKAPGFKSVLERLRDLCRRGDHLQRSRSIEALTEFRDRFAVDALVGLLGTRPETIAEEARQALVVLTCQDFRQSERRWRAWYADHGQEPRTRWLIDALHHKSAELRKLAQDELHKITGQNFGYDAEAPRRARETAAKTWLDWWRVQGADTWP